jgi:hypothetical protein
VEVKVQCQVKISNRFAALKKLDDDDLASVRLGKVLQYEIFSHKESRILELKQHKPWFDEKCSFRSNEAG